MEGEKWSPCSSSPAGAFGQSSHWWLLNIMSGGEGDGKGDGGWDLRAKGTHAAGASVLHGKENVFLRFKGTWMSIK